MTAWTRNNHWVSCCAKIIKNSDSVLVRHCVQTVCHIRLLLFYYSAALKKWGLYWICPVLRHSVILWFCHSVTFQMKFFVTFFSQELWGLEAQGLNFDTVWVGVLWKLSQILYRSVTDSLTDGHGFFSVGVPASREVEMVIMDIFSNRAIGIINFERLSPNFISGTMNWFLNSMLD